MKSIDPKVYRSGVWRRHVFSVLVWVGTTAAVVGLFYHRSQRFEVLGIAQGEVRQIVASCDGRLKIVPVKLFEKVNRGQIVAVLDDELLNAQIATVSAEIERLMAELIPTQDQLEASAANLETNWTADSRRFSIDVENARLRVLELITLLETDRIMLEDLALEVKIAQELLREDAIAPYELQKAEALYSTLAKKIEENEHLMEQAKQDLEQAQQRQGEFARRQPRHALVDSALEPIRKAINVQEKLIDELLAQRKALTIRSPIDGVVIQIQGNANQAALRRQGESVLHMSGDAVLAGEPILVVAEAAPSEIIAYATEEQINQIQEGMRVELIKDRRPAQIAQSQVTYVGPVVEQMPLRLWRNPNIPQWGRPFLVKVPPKMKLTPGELVGMRRL